MFTSLEVGSTGSAMYNWGLRQTTLSKNLVIMFLRIAVKDAPGQSNVHSVLFRFQVSNVGSVEVVTSRLLFLHRSPDDAR